MIHINGAPGVGKLTIAKYMASHLKARILDNHAIYNVGFALADFRTPAFYEAVRAVRTAAFEQILGMADNETLILTAADYGDSDWGHENWQAVEQLAEKRRWPFFTIALFCTAEEHRRRITGEDRRERGKLLDPNAVDTLSQRPIITGSGPLSLQLDVTGLTAGDAATHLVRWIERSAPNAPS